MKGGFYGLRGKRISLTLIALVCSTILIWAWENTPLLTSLLPPQGHLLQLSPEILMGVPTALESHTTSVTSVIEEEVVNEHHEETPPEIEKSKANVITIPFIDKGDEPEKETARKQEINSDTLSGVVSENSPHVEGREEEDKEKLALEAEHQAESSAYLEASVAAPNASSFIRDKADKKSRTPVKKQGCNYVRGKWVVDDSRPLYSGFGCKQWLSGMWACRMTHRTDFAYEKLRWQPSNCAMEEFTGSKFLQRTQHKTIAFVGDSLGRQQFQSLMCIVTGGNADEMPDVLDVGKEYGLVKTKGSARPDGWAYRFPKTNTTILYYWSASLSDLEPLDNTNPLITDYAMHLDRPPAFLQRFLPKFDVLVLNTGHHWNRGKFRANRWVMHVGGVPNIDRKTIASAKNFTVHSIVHWVNSQLFKYPWLKAFFRTLSPRHFFHGDWNTGGTCDNTTPLSGGKEVFQDPGSSDPCAAQAVMGTKVTLLDITAISQLRDEGHISRYNIKSTPGSQDCLHWCLPGVPDTWNEILFAQL